MTIKKISTVKAAPQSRATGAAPADGEVADMPAAGGATIADRFKLDAPDPATLAKATASKKATQFALTAAFLALAVAGILTFILYKHWEFLMPA